MDHPLLQIGDDVGYGRPGSLLDRPSCLVVAEALEEALEQEAKSKMVNAWEDGVADNLDNTLPASLQLLLQHLGKGLELPQHIRVPGRNL
jgi:hypothetical protein